MLRDYLRREREKGKEGEKEKMRDGVPAMPLSSKKEKKTEGREGSEPRNERLFCAISAVN